MYYTSAHLQYCKDRKNKWRGVLKHKDPIQNKWVEKKKTFAGVKYKRDAQIELNKWREEMEAKAPYVSNKLTVSIAITKYLQMQYRLNQINVSTYQGSLKIIETVINPRIGNKEFAEFSKKDAQDFINDLAKDYEPQSVRRYFNIVSKTFKEAYRNDELLRDPTKDVILPRIIRKPINYLDSEGRKKFLSVMTERSSFYLPSMLAYYTGMRSSEISALQWKDINIPMRTINVRQSAVFEKDPEKNNELRLFIGETKTPKSRRTIPIVAQLVPILLKAAEDKNPNINDFVVSQQNPKLLSTSFLKWANRNKIIGSAGKPISMHGLRHTFATVGVQSGMDIKSLSSILGHANTAMTLDIYASDDETAKRIAIDNLSAFFNSDSENEL